MEPTRDIQIPLDPSDLGGRFSVGGATVLSQRDGRGVARIIWLNGEEVTWLEAFDKVYFQTLRDGATLKAVRKATDEDIKKYRVPVWIQGEEVPSCCGRPMFFVCQLDDDLICTEAPPDAEMWWHDAASFYVFTCPRCLEVKAVGQQF